MFVNMNISLLNLLVQVPLGNFEPDWLMFTADVFFSRALRDQQQVFLWECFVWFNLISTVWNYWYKCGFKDLWMFTFFFYLVTGWDYYLNFFFLKPSIFSSPSSFKDFFCYYSHNSFLRTWNSILTDSLDIWWWRSRFRRH